MKRIIILLALSLSFTAFGQPDATDGWPLFARVKFNTVLYKELNEYFLVPSFDKTITSMVGTEITLQGFYIPFDLPKNRLVISKSPYSSCFFCGGAGPESVAEVIFKTKAPKLKTDQAITIKGKLKLNNKDINQLNFILVDAEWIN
jgi:uncharacterized membrane protein YcgQ (UPF0703/DUF1980 family)